MDAARTEISGEAGRYEDHAQIPPGERIYVRYLDPAQREQIPKIEDMIPKGLSEESEIIELGAKIMKVKSKDGVGNEKLIVNYRRNRPFISK